MELRHLRLFIVVAEEGHITRAAERLGMQQPPLSQQIKAIERELDVQLFLRKPRGVELTNAGRALLEDARAILARLEHAFERTRRTARGELGRISVGLSLTSTHHPFVPQIIRAFREAYPSVLLTLEEGRGSEFAKHLRSERIDAAFVRAPPVDPEGLVVNAVLQEPMVIALPTSHRLSHSRQNAAIPLKALAGETFIGHASQHAFGFRAATLAAYREAGFSPRIGQEAPTTTSAVNFVAVGLGITFVPASMQRLRIDGVAYRRLKDAAKLIAPLILVSRRGDPSAVVRHFLSLVTKTARKIGGNL